MIQTQTKDFMSTVRSVSCRFLLAQSTWRLERKIANNAIVSPYPSRSVVQYTMQSSAGQRELGAPFGSGRGWRKTVLG